MLIIRQYIADNRGTGESLGTLDKFLANSMGIGKKAKAKDLPDLYQMAKFYTAINVFLKQVFVDEDSALSHLRWQL
ncbi:MAG: hypothetical protein ACRCXC_11300 [Legionella sp.]